MGDVEQAAEKDAPALRVEIEERIGKPTACKVWRGERLIFDGVDRSALTSVTPPICQYRSHSRPEGNEPCDCEARLAAVAAHHVVDDPAIGPPFCQECSEAISEYVPWDAAHQARVTSPGADQ